MFRTVEMASTVLYVIGIDQLTLREFMVYLELSSVIFKITQ